jgi:hypothetical protein
MTKPIKILICGHAHCGTSILKSIIGHIEDVEEIVNECSYINKSTDKKYILCKKPNARPEFFDKKYDDYIKIFIIRNPLFVFSSINKRFGHYKLAKNLSIEGYVNILKMFIKFKNNPEKNIYTIRYEDLFQNNYQELKKILDDIGFQYDDNIFDNSKYTNSIIKGVKLVNKKPENKRHGFYRTWQINQPFVSNNDISKIDLSNDQKKKIINNPYILQVYPDINSVFTKQ